MYKQYVVEISRKAEKQLWRLPKQIREALSIWLHTIEVQGAANMRRLPGYHDEPLKGARRGQRSSRLSRAYRVIYEERSGEVITIIFVLEVNKHDY